MKLTKIQAELKAPKNQRNNFGNYNYRSCEDIVEALKPLLSKHEVTLWLDDEMVLVGNRVYVKATATLVDGDLITKAHGWAREDETRKGMDASQITGSASSYARKYALNALFLIDDTKDSDATNTHEDKIEAKPVAAPAKVEPKVDAVKGRVIGRIKTRIEGTAGFMSYGIGDVLVTTRKGEDIDILDKAKEDKAEVQVDYATIVKGKYTNHYIEKITDVEPLPF